MKKSALLATLLAALTLSACGGGSSAVCDEYEKAFADATKKRRCSYKRYDAKIIRTNQRSFEKLAC